jgi:hypothetical protein
MVYSGEAVPAGIERRPSPLNVKRFTHTNTDTPVFSAELEEVSQGYWSGFGKNEPK